MKKEKEERISIGDLHSGIYAWLANATIAGLIPWRPTGEPAVEMFGPVNPVKGYRAEIGDLTVETIVRVCNCEKCSKKEVKEKSAAAIRITKGTQDITITSDRGIIPGVRCAEETYYLLFLCERIHNEITQQDLVNSLQRELGRLLFSKRGGDKSCQ